MFVRPYLLLDGPSSLDDFNITRPVFWSAPHSSQNGSSGSSSFWHSTHFGRCTSNMILSRVTILHGRFAIIYLIARCVIRYIVNNHNGQKGPQTQIPNSCGWITSRLRGKWVWELRTTWDSMSICLFPYPGMVVEIRSNLL